MLISWLLFVFVHRTTQFASSQILNLTCMNLPENECHQSVFKTTESGCEGWICWESQLTLANKRFIASTLNKHRNSISQNITNMNKLVTITEIMPPQNFDQHNNGYSLVCENGCMYQEDMVLPSQNQFKQLLFSFLKENSLHQTDIDGNYRRGSAQFVGCALVVMRTIVDNSYQNIFALVCVFCTRDSKMKTIFKQNDQMKNECSYNTVLGADPRFPNLCSDLGLRNLFICEPQNPCPEYPKTEVWRSDFQARISRLSLFQTTVGPILLINESVTVVSQLADGTNEAKTNFVVYVDTEGAFGKVLQRYPPVPRSMYFYSEDKARQFNESLHSQMGANVYFVYAADADTCEVVIPTAAIEGTVDAFCCLYLMAAASATTLILGALFVYTVNDYRKKFQ